MKDVKAYDGDLKMFRETPRPVDMARLHFLRWLAEQGRLEHLPAGPSSGELAEAPGRREQLVEAA